MARVQHTRRFPFVSVVMILWLTGWAWGDVFVGGTGWADDPYQIADVNGLLAISEDSTLLSRHYVLVNDIVLEPNSVEGQAVIEDSYTIRGGRSRAELGGVQGGFSGSLDGQGHVIANLPIPLFETIASGGEVSNLGLPNIRVNTSKDAGGLVTTNWGTIERCYVQGELSTTGVAGGIVGISQYDGTVTDCYALVSIGQSIHAGGLVGVLYDGSIQRCYSTGRLLDDPDQAYLPLVKSGVVAGATAVGQSYFLCEGTPDSKFGIPLTDSQMRAIGSFEGWDFAGRTTDGSQDVWFMPDDGYPILIWQPEADLMEVPDLAGTRAEEAEATLNAAGFVLGQVQEDYDPSVEAGTIIASDPVNYAPAGAAVSIFVSLGRYDWSTNPGDGTSVLPYEIATVGQLLCAGPEPPEGAWGWEYYGGTFYILVNSLDMSSRVFSEAPIGNFMDILDGQGHAIANLTIQTNGGNVGLFGTISAPALVSNLTLENVSIAGVDTECIGALAGVNEGLIENCHAEGTVEGSGFIGGLVGQNAGWVSVCHAAGTVVGRPGYRYDNSIWVPQPDPLPASAAGGLVGVCKDGVVSACYATTDVSADYSETSTGEVVTNIHLGGLIGQLGLREVESTTRGGYTEAWYGGTAINSYATGQRSSNWSDSTGGRMMDSPESGALVGSVFRGDIINCYALDAPLAGDTNSAISSYYLGSDGGLWNPWAEPAPRAMGLTDQEMKQQASYRAWDFEHIWTICEGLDYPHLWWENHQCP